MAPSLVIPIADIWEVLLPSCFLTHRIPNPCFFFYSFIFKVFRWVPLAEGFKGFCWRKDQIKNINLFNIWTYQLNFRRYKMRSSKESEPRHNFLIFCLFSPQFGFVQVDVKKRRDKCIYAFTNGVRTLRWVKGRVSLVVFSSCYLFLHHWKIERWGTRHGRFSPFHIPPPQLCFRLFTIAHSLVEIHFPLEWSHNPIQKRTFSINLNGTQTNLNKF